MGRKKAFKNKEKREISFEDIAIGDVVEFYDVGFRFDIVVGIKKKRKFKSLATKYVIVTERYGKIFFGRIRNVLIVEDGKTVNKSLINDLFF